MPLDGAALEIGWAGSNAVHRIQSSRLRFRAIRPETRPVGRLYALPFFADAHCHIPAEGAGPGRAPTSEERTRVVLRQRAASFVERATDMGVGALAAWNEKPRWVKSALRGLTGHGADVDTRRFASPVGAGGEAATAVAENVRLGSDLVKVIATGSGLAQRDEATRPIIDDATIAEIAVAARGHGLLVAAHCHGGAAVDALVEAGVSSIEHGLYLTPAQLDAMKNAGIALTLTPGAYLSTAPARMAPVLASLVREALDHGVTLRVGTDGEDQTMLGQVRWLVTLGVPFGTAIGISADWSVNREDAAALARPLILFDDDPARDPSMLERPSFTAEPEGWLDD